MKGLRPVATVLLTLALATPAVAVTWSVGTVADKRSGLSLQYRHQPRQAIHLTTQFMTEEVFALEGHWQKFFMPYTRSFNYQFYSGLGLLGEAVRDHEQGESYWLALPLGAQWNPAGLPVEFFGEMSALMGELPDTALRGRVRGGVRAVF